MIHMKTKKLTKIMALILSIWTAISMMCSIALSASAYSPETFYYNTSNFYPLSITCGGNGITVFKPNGMYAYCIQHGNPVYDGYTYYANDQVARNVYNHYSQELKDALGIVLYYGAGGESTGSLPNNDTAYAATQTLIWELLAGARNTNFEGSNNEIWTLNDSTATAKSYYAELLQKCRAFLQKPSFAAQSGQLSYNTSNGKYEYTFNDSNNVTSNYAYSANPQSGVTLTKSSSALKVSSSSNMNFTINGLKSIQTNTGLLLWGCTAVDASRGSAQSLISSGQLPTIRFSMSVKKQPTGTLIINKQFANMDTSGGTNRWNGDYSVTSDQLRNITMSIRADGVQQPFYVKGKNGVYTYEGTAGSHTSGSFSANALTLAYNGGKGKLTINNIPEGYYIITENIDQKISYYGYVQNDNKGDNSPSIVAGQTKSVTIYNEPTCTRIVKTFETSKTTTVQDFINVSFKIKQNKNVLKFKKLGTGIYRYAPNISSETGTTDTLQFFTASEVANVNARRSQSSITIYGLPPTLTYQLSETVSGADSNRYRISVNDSYAGGFFKVSESDLADTADEKRAGIIEVVNEEKQQGTITINKTFKSNNTIIPDTGFYYCGTILPSFYKNIKFRVTDEDGNVLTFNKNGTNYNYSANSGLADITLNYQAGSTSTSYRCFAKLTGLPYGKYIITETNSYGFEPNHDSQTVTLSYSSDSSQYNKSVSFVNNLETETGKVVITKKWLYNGLYVNINPSIGRRVNDPLSSTVRFKVFNNTGATDLTKHFYQTAVGEYEYRATTTGVDALVLKDNNTIILRGIPTESLGGSASYQLLKIREYMHLGSFPGYMFTVENPDSEISISNSYCAQETSVTLSSGVVARCTLTNVARTKPLTIIKKSSNDNIEQTFYIKGYVQDGTEKKYITRNMQLTADPNDANVWNKKVKTKVDPEDLNKPLGQKNGIYTIDLPTSYATENGSKVVYYEITEQVPKYYTVSPSATQTVTLTGLNAQSSVTFTNSPPKAVLIINKKVEVFDKETNTTKYVNATSGQVTYTITNDYNNETWVKETTGSNLSNIAVAGINGGVYLWDEDQGKMVYHKIKYTITETSPPTGYVAHKPKDVYFRYDAENNQLENLTVTFENPMPRGTVYVVKRDSETNELISDAAFALYYDYNGQKKLYGNLTQDADNPGTYYIEDVPIGAYYVKETTIPDRYYQNIYTSEFTPVNVQAEGRHYIYTGLNSSSNLVESGAKTNPTNPDRYPYFNYPLLCKLKVRKQSSETQATLSGAEFYLFRDNNANGIYDSGDQQIGQLQETSTGIFEIDSIPLGHYLINENKVPANYIGTTWTPLNITRASLGQNIDPSTFGTHPEVNITINNEPIKGSIKIIKKDAISGAKLNGAVFTVYSDSNNNGKYNSTDAVYGTVPAVSGQLGVYKLTNIPAGLYFVKETTVPTGYRSKSKTYTVNIQEKMQYIISDVDVDENGQESQELGYVKNDPIIGNIKLTKVNEKGTKLAGAKFTLYKNNQIVTSDIYGNTIQDDENGTPGTLTTNSKGVVTFKNLRYGTYTVKETTAPENYNLNTTVYTFNITEHGKTYQPDANVVDPIKSGKLRIIKYARANPNGTNPSTLSFRVSGKTIGGWKFSQDVDVTMSQNPGTYYPSYELRGEATIDIPFSADGEVYTIQEINVPEFYQTPEAKTTTITTTARKDVTFFNKLASFGEINVTKVDSETIGTNNLRKISGATLTATKGTETWTLVESTTNPGTYSVHGLESGTYTIKETQAPDGYYKDQGTYTVYIPETSSTFSINLSNHNLFHKEYIPLNNSATGQMLTSIYPDDNATGTVKNPASSTNPGTFSLLLKVNKNTNYCLSMLSPSSAPTQNKFRVAGYTAVPTAGDTGKLLLSSTSTRVGNRIYGNFNSGNNEYILVFLWYRAGSYTFTESSVRDFIENDAQIALEKVPTLLSNANIFNKANIATGANGQKIAALYSDTNGQILQGNNARSLVIPVEPNKKYCLSFISPSDAATYNKKIITGCATEPAVGVTGTVLTTSMSRMGDRVYTTFTTGNDTNYVLMYLWLKDSTHDFTEETIKNLLNSEMDLSVEKTGIPAIEGYGQYFVENPVKCNIKITKVDANHPDKKLGGAKYRVEYLDDATLFQTRTVTTVSSGTELGTITLYDVPCGTYRITETQAPTNYTIAEDPIQEITVTSSGTFNVTFENEKATAWIKVIKVAEDNYVTGWKFLATSTEYTTDQYKTQNTVKDDDTGNGYITMEVPIGTYTIQELGRGSTETIPDRYIVPANQTITVTSANTESNPKTVTFNNVLKRGTVNVTKVDRDDPTSLVSGAVFYIRKNNTARTYVGKLTEDTNNPGHYSYTGLTYGDYILVEKSVGKKYILDTNDYPFNMTDNNQSITITNNLLNLTYYDLVKLYPDTANNGNAKSGSSSYSLIVPVKPNTTYTVTRDSTSGTGNRLNVAGYETKPSNGTTATFLSQVTTSAITNTFTTTSNTHYILLYSWTGSSYPETTVRGLVESGVVSLTDNTSFGNTPIRGNILVRKVDEKDPTILIAGAKFKIFQIDDSTTPATETQIGTTYTTSSVEGDAFGTFTVNNLPYGKYKLVETSAPSGYSIADPIEFQITNNAETLTITVGDPRTTGWLKIIKTVDDGSNLNGFTFTVTGTSKLGTAINETFTTDSNGIILQELEISDSTGYTIQEINVPERYIAPASKTVTITASHTETSPRTVSFTNTLKKGNVQVTKEDDEGNPVSGATFKIYDVSGSYVATLTEVSGTPGTYQYLNLPYGEYILKETAVPTIDVNGTSCKKYVRDTTSYPFEIVTNGETVYVPGVNEPIVNPLSRGNIKVIKKDAETGEVLSGAKYIITDLNDVQIGSSKTTNSNGEALFENLPLGSYKVVETKAPSYYDLGTDTTHIVHVKKNGSTYSTTFMNTKTYVWLEIHKTADDNVLTGVQFKIQGTSTIANKRGESNDVDILTNGTTLSADGTYGVVKLKVLRGNYIISEYNTPARYQAPAPTGNIAMGVSYTEDNPRIITFANTITGTVKTTKVITDTPNNKISGAVFTIYQDTSSKPVVGTMTSDSNGVAQMNLGYGNYILKETSVDSKYILDSNEYKFSITTNGQVCTIGNNLFNKDRYTLMQLYPDSNNNGQAKSNSGTYSILLPVKENTTYHLDCIDADNNKHNRLIVAGYASQPTNGTEALFYDNSGSRQNGVSTNTFTTEAGTKYVLLYMWTGSSYPESLVTSIIDEGRVFVSDDVSFGNPEVLGKIQITKVDSEDPTIKLSGAKFTIKNADGTSTVKTLTTDANGYAEYTLPYGTYQVTETTVPSHYVGDPKTYIFSITQEGQVYTLTNQGKLFEAPNNFELVASYISSTSPNKFMSSTRSYSLVIPVLPNTSYRFSINKNNQNHFSFAEFASKPSFGDTPIDGTYSSTSQLNGDIRYRSFVTSATTQYLVVYLWTDKEDVPNLIATGDIHLDYDYEITTLYPNQTSGKATQSSASHSVIIGVEPNTQYRVALNNTATHTNGNQFRIATYITHPVAGTTGTLITNAATAFENGIEYMTFTTGPNDHYLMFFGWQGSSIYSDTQIQSLIDNKDFTVTSEYFANSIIKGIIKVQKLDADTNQPLAGAIFELRTTSGTVIERSSATGSDGWVTFTNVPYGTYRVYEVQAPTGYALYASYYACSITTNGQERSGTISNPVKTTTLEIRKTSEDNIVTGFTFRITGTKINGETYTVNTNATTQAGSGSNIYGTTTITLPLGTYTITENNVPARYIAPAAKTVTVIDGTNSPVTFNNTLKKGTIKITKVSGDNITSKVSGAVFEVLDSQGNRVGDTITTNSSGIAQKTNLPYGDYTVREISAPDQFVIDTNEYTVQIRNNGATYTVCNNLLNPRITSPVRLYPTSPDGTTASAQKSYSIIMRVAPNTTYTITVNDATNSNHNKLLIGEYASKPTTSSTTTGLAYYSDSNARTKTFTTTASTQYILVCCWYDNTSYTQTAVQNMINSGAINITDNVSFANPVKRGTVQLTKTSIDNPSQKLQNAVFEIVRTSDNTIVSSNVKTNANGIAQYKNLSYGNYTIQEIQAPTGFVLDPTIYPFSITADGEVVTISNYRNLFNESDCSLVDVYPYLNTGVVTTGTNVGSLKLAVKPNTTYCIYLTSPADSAKINRSRLCEYATDPVEGTQALTYDNSDMVRLNNTEVVYKTFTTSADTHYVLLFLWSGISAAGIQTRINAANITIEEGPTTPDHADYTQLFTNPEIRGSIKVIKEDAETHALLSGAVFELRNNSDNSLIATGTTNDNGEYVFSGLTKGTYKVVEVTPPTNYNLSAITTKTATITTDGSQVSVTFSNTLKTGVLKIIKIAEDGVTGFKFRIQGTALNGQTIDQYATTQIDSNNTAQGVVLVTLPISNGNYTITETGLSDGSAIPARYIVPSAQSKAITASHTSTNPQTATFNNNLKKGKIVVTKKDKDTGAVLQGAVFELQTSAGVAVAGFERKTTGTNGQCTFENVPYGTYRITEITAPTNYNKTSPTYKTATVSSNGQTVTVAAFENPLKTGKLTIVKIADDGATDFKFRIQGTALNGETVDQYVSTAANPDNASQGIIKDIVLKYGTYTITETSFADGTSIGNTYILPSAQTVTINTTGTVTKTFYNHIQGTIQIQKVVSSNQNTTLSGVEFTIQKVGESTTTTIATNASGIAEKTGLSYGTYTVKEKTVDSAYVKDNNTYTVNVTENGKIYYVTNNLFTPNFYQLTNLYPYSNTGTATLNTKTYSVIIPVKPNTTYTLNLPNSPNHNKMRLAGYQDLPKAGDTCTLYKTVSATATTMSFTTTVDTQYILFYGWYNDNDQIDVADIHNEIKTNLYLTDNISFGNPLATGTLKIVKIADDQETVFTFQVTGTATDGTDVNEIISTDTSSVDNTRGVATLTLKPGTYLVKEINYPSRYTIRNGNNKSVTVVAGSTKSVTFYNDIYGTISLTKVDDEDTSMKLQNAKFRIYDSNNQQVGSDLTTNANGTFTSPSLRYGNYTIQEVTAPTGYVRDTNTYSFSITNDTPVIISNRANDDYFGNPKIKGNIPVLKVDKNTQAPLSGAIFELQDSSGNPIQGFSRGTTGIDGTYTFTNVPYGTYRITEIQAPTNYSKASPSYQTATITANGVTISTLKFENPLQTGTLKIIKIAEDGVTGFRFRIQGTAKNGETVDQYVNTVTDTNNTTQGVISVTLPISNGNYTITEVGLSDGSAIPTRYVAPAAQNKAVTAGNTTTVTFRNNLRKGTIKVIKQDKDTSALLNGAVFELRDKDTNTLIATGTTGSQSVNGTFEFTNVPYGTYKLIEITAPTNYNKANPDNQEVSITTNGQTVTKTFKNPLKTGTLKVIKIADDGVTNFRFRIQGTAKNGQTIDQYINTVPDSNDASKGVQTVTLKISEGNYTVTEVGMPDGSNIPARYTTTPNVNQTVSITAGQTKTLTFYNEIYGTISLTKVDDEDTSIKLQNAKFRIFDSNNQQVGSDLTTNANGTFTSPSLRYGNYTIQEVTAPTGYVRDTQIYSFSITDNIPVIISNRTNDDYFGEPKIKGTVKVIKKDTDTQALLNGAVFELRKNSDNTLVATGTTGAQGTNGTFEFRNVPYGTYKLIEITAPTNYNKATPDNQSVTINTNNQTVTKTFNNPLQTGTLIIHKLADDGVTTFKFRIQGTATNGQSIDQTVETSTNPNNSAQGIKEVTLKIGTYTITEIDVPARYQGPAAQTVDISNNTVTNTNVFRNIINGTVSLTKVDSWDNNIKLANAHFKVYKDDANKTPIDGELITNINGEASKNLPYGNYIIKEITAPSGYIKDNTEYRFSITSNGQQIVISNINGTQYFGNPPESGTLNIIKTSDDNATQFTFRITGASTTGVAINQTVTTTADTANNRGVATITLRLSDVSGYTVTEINKPSRYGDVDSQVVHLDTNGTTQTLTFHNPIKGSVQLTKVDDGRPTVKLPNARFQVYNASTNTAYGPVLITDQNGFCELTEIPYGNYYIKEITAPTNYVKDNNNYNFNITTNGQVCVISNRNQDDYFGNPPKTTTLTIIKQAEDYETVFDFRVVKTSNIGAAYNTVVHTATDPTNTNQGIVTITVDVGTYQITEINVPSRYAIPAMQNKTVEYGQTNTVTFINALKQGTVQVSKVDSENTNKKLSGAVFEVRRADNNAFVATLSEIEQGLYQCSTLTYGNYVLVETSAPEGYIASSVTYPFSITQFDTPVVLNDIPNTPIKGSVQLTKINSRKVSEKISGAVFTITNLNTSDTYTLTTGTNGFGQVTGLPYGRYSIQETSVNAKYVKDTEVYYFNITTNNQVCTISNRTEDDYFGNPEVLGNIKVIKRDADTNALLQGAVFALRNTDNTTVAGFSNQTTNINGECIFENVPYGTYKIVEITAPTNYKKSSPDNQSVTIDTDGQTITKTFNNPLQTGTLTIIKVADDGVTDFRFRIQGVAKNGQVIDQYVNTAADPNNNTRGIVTVTLKVSEGTYTVSEVGLPNGDPIPNRYNAPANQTVTIVANTNTTTNVFENKIRGTISLVKVDNRNTNVKLSNAKFQIYKDDTSKTPVGSVLTTNSNGTFVSPELIYGNYIIKEIQAPTGYVCDNTEYKFSITTNGQVCIISNRAQDDYFGDPPILGTITVIKLDQATNNPLSGAVFELRDTNDQPISNINRGITGTNGQYSFLNVPYGNYKVVEITPPEHYEVVSTNTQTCNIVNNGDVKTLTFKNPLKTGNLTIIKQADDGHTAFKFRIQGTALDGTTIDTYVNTATNPSNTKQGIATVAIKVGTYTVTEYSFDDGTSIGTSYIIPAAQTAVVTDDNTTVLPIFYNHIKGSIRLIKVDDDDSSVKLANAVFQIYDANTRIAYGSPFTTNASGVGQVTDIPYGHYFVKEITPPPGFVLDPNEYSVDITENDHEYVIYNRIDQLFGNVTSTGSIVVTKLDSETEAPLANAVFELRYSNNQPVQNNSGQTIRGTTNDNGTYTFFGLKPNTYKVVEITAPTGYKLSSPTSQTATIQNDGDQVSLTFTNPPQTGVLKIVKIAEDGVTGFRFHIVGTAINGTQIDQYVNTQTDPDHVTQGFVTVTLKISEGTYTITETGLSDGSAIPARYIVPASQNVTLTSAHTTANPLVVTFNNTIKKGSIQITKVNDEDPTVKLANAEFQVYDADTRIAYGAKLITNENGFAELTNIPYGHYFIKEITAPTNYVKDNNEYSFDITANGQVCVISNRANDDFFGNPPEYGYLKIVKTAYDNETSFQFRVTGTSNTGVAFEQVVTTTAVNNHGEYTLRVLTGSYTINEINIPVRYLTPEAQTLTVTTDNDIDNPATATIHNAAAQGTVRIEKVDSQDSTKHISGVVFKIYKDNASRDEIGEMTETSAGIYEYTNLLYGQYIVQEISAPAEYIIDSNEYTFTISNNTGAVVVSNHANQFDATNANVVSLYPNQQTGTANTTSNAYSLLIAVKPNTQYCFSLTDDPMETNRNRMRVAGYTTVPQVNTTSTFLDDTATRVNDRVYNTFTTTEDTHYILVFLWTSTTFTPERIDEIVSTANIVLEENATTMNPLTYQNYFTNTPIQATVHVIKEDADTHQRLQGAVFGLYNASGTKLDEATSNDQGIATFNNVKYGNYTVVEITPPTNYILNDTSYPIQVRENGQTYTQIVTNTAKTGYLKITKFAHDSAATTFTFQITGTSLTGETINRQVTIDTDATGHGETAVEIKLGTYTIQEVNVDDRYVIPENQTVTVEEANTSAHPAVAAFENVLKVIIPDYGTIRILKRDANNHQALQGALFELRDSEGHVIQQQRTNSNGIAIFENVEYGSYQVVEIEAPEHYIINTAVFTCNVNSETPIEYTFDDLPELGDVKIVKVSDDGRVSGVKFRVHGTVLQGYAVDITVQTNDNGIAYVSDLVAGDYTIEEVEVPEIYEVPASQTVTIIPKNVVTVNSSPQNSSTPTHSTSSGARTVVFQTVRKKEDLTH